MFDIPIDRILDLINVRILAHPNGQILILPVGRNFDLPNAGSKLAYRHTLAIGVTCLVRYLKKKNVRGNRSCLVDGWVIGWTSFVFFFVLASPLRDPSAGLTVIQFVGYNGTGM